MKKLAAFLRDQRKLKFKAVSEFLKECNLDIPESNYYAYESGMLIPKPEDLHKIIKALKLNARYAFMLWLHDHLPDESLRVLFPIPKLSGDEDNKIENYNINETMSISKGHVGYFIKNRLARVLLAFFYVNSSSPLRIDYICNEFKKHPQKNILRELKKLDDMGYIGKSGKDTYVANAKFIYTPNTQEFAKFREETMVDMIRTSNIDDTLVTEYGQYNKGHAFYFRRTLTPAQLDFVIDLFGHAYNEARRVPAQPGQEFNICFLVGAMYEK